MSQKLDKILNLMQKESLKNIKYPKRYKQFKTENKWKNKKQISEPL